jgi:hypothetical protein
MNLCYKVALNNYHGSKPYQMGWHDRRNDNKYREYKVKNKRNNYRREPLPNRNRQEYNPVRYSSGNMKDKDNDYKHKDNR